MRAPAFLDRALFAELAGKAGQSPRRRAHHNLHEMSEPCHRLAVGLQPDTYIPPHRHLCADKAETLLVLQGRIGLLLFAEDGTLEQTRLLEAGWTSVRIVTDHGWLYLPEGLPKVDLPKHLTLSRWARCAVIAGTARRHRPLSGL